MNRYQIKAAANGRSELRIYGDIGRSWWEDESNDAKTVVTKLAGMTGPVDVRIGSFGGSVADGLAIFNALRRYSDEIITHIDSVAYSIASLIAMGGDEIRMAANGMIMVHAPWGGVVGNAPEMREMADVLDRHAEAMILSYTRDGGPNTETIRGWLTDGTDHYFDAAEAVAIGLVDHVTDQQPVLAIAAQIRSAASDRYRIPAASCISTQEENAIMAENTIPGGGSPDPTTTKPDIMASHSRTVKAATAKGAMEEAKRRRAVTDVFAGFYDADPLNPVTTLHDKCMENLGCNELEARRELMTYLEMRTADDGPILAAEQYGGIDSPERPPPKASRYLGGAVQASRDVADKRSIGLMAALSIKAGIETDKAVIDRERKGEFLSLSLIDIMAHEMRAQGMPITGSREDIARKYCQGLPAMAAGPSHGTDHLPYVLGNIANLAAMQGWDGSAETWSQWTQAGTLNNYQTATRANNALLDKLTQMAENQEWEYGDMADVRQRITGYFHGLKYALSIQAMVNDDLGELQRTMNGWGESAAATVGDTVHVAMFASGSGGFGQTMDEDSQILFHADHGNYIASGSGAIPSVATLNAARTAMLTQTDTNSRKVAAIPRYVIHGPSNWATVDALLNSTELQNITVDGTSDVTTFSGRTNSARRMNLIPIEEYRIVASAPAATAWVLAAARRTVEVAGVGGPIQPRAEQSMVSNTPGITYELSMPFGVAALDYRGMYFNHGA